MQKSLFTGELPDSIFIQSGREQDCWLFVVVGVIHSSWNANIRLSELHKSSKC